MKTKLHVTLFCMNSDNSCNEAKTFVKTYDEYMSLSPNTTVSIWYKSIQTGSSAFVDTHNDEVNYFCSKIDIGINEWNDFMEYLTNDGWKY